MSDRPTPEHRLTLDVTNAGIFAARNTGERVPGNVNFAKGSLLRDVTLTLLSWLANDWIGRSASNPMSLTVLKDNRGFELLGRCLYDILFQDKIEDALKAAWQAARNDKDTLHVVLNFTEATELANLPWEYLWYPDIKDFMCRHARMVLTRYINRSLPHRPLATSQLKILVVYTRPTSLRSVEPHTTINSIQDYVEKLKQKIEPYNESKLRINLVAPLENMSFLNFSKLIKKEKPHILHFIGHGEYNSQQKGWINFAHPDDESQIQVITDAEFARVCGDEEVKENLRLVILQICESGHVDFVDGEDGFVPRLMDAEVPAVIAMQHPVHAYAAADFMEAFYQDLLKSNDIGQAVQRGRMAISTPDSVLLHNSVYAFGSPVLYMRTDDGTILDISFPGDDKSQNPAQVGRIVTELVPVPIFPQSINDRKDGFSEKPGIGGRETPPNSEHTDLNERQAIVEKLAPAKTGSVPVEDLFSQAISKIKLIAELRPTERAVINDGLRLVRRDVRELATSKSQRNAIKAHRENLMSQLNADPYLEYLYDALSEIEENI